MKIDRVLNTTASIVAVISFICLIIGKNTQNEIKYFFLSVLLLCSLSYGCYIIYRDRKINTFSSFWEMIKEESKGSNQYVKIFNTVKVFIFVLILIIILPFLIFLGIYAYIMSFIEVYQFLLKTFVS